jgi:hypothetical protein
VQARELSAGGGSGSGGGGGALARVDAEGLRLHFDKDEDALDEQGLLLHPHLSTVT